MVYQQDLGDSGKWDHCESQEELKPCNEDPEGVATRAPSDTESPVYVECQSPDDNEATEEMEWQNPNTDSQLATEGSNTQLQETGEETGNFDTFTIDDDGDGNYFVADGSGAMWDDSVEEDNEYLEEDAAYSGDNDLLEEITATIDGASGYAVEAPTDDAVVYMEVDTIPVDDSLYVESTVFDDDTAYDAPYDTAYGYENNDSAEIDDDCIPSDVSLMSREAANALLQEIEGGWRMPADRLRDEFERPGGCVVRSPTELYRLWPNATCVYRPSPRFGTFQSPENYSPLTPDTSPPSPPTPDLITEASTAASDDMEESLSRVNGFDQFLESDDVDPIAQVLRLGA